MSSKRKTSAPTRVLVDVDTGQSEAVQDADVTVADHDYDSDQSHDRSLRVVTSPSSLSADDDDVTRPPDDVTRVAGGRDDVTVTSWRPWLCAEVTSVLTRIQSVIAGAPSVDDKRRRVEEMLTELETIRRHLLMTQSDITSLPVCDIIMCICDGYYGRPVE